MKIKTILFTSLLGLMASGASAESSAWVGERMDCGNPYYFYNSLNSSFLSHDSKDGNQYPAYSDLAGADLFWAEKSGEYMKIKNLSLSGDNLYVSGGTWAGFNGSTNIYPFSSTSNARAFVYNSSKNDNSGDYIFKFYYKNVDVKYSFYAQSGTQGNEGRNIIAITKGDKDHQWKFISPEQYYGRPKLDAIVQMVNEKVQNSAISNEILNSQAYQKAVEAQISKPSDIGVLGSEILSCYSTLTNAYNEALYPGDENKEFRVAYSQLMSLINMTIERAPLLANDDQSKYASLNEKLDAAKSALESASPDNVKSLTDAKNALSEAVVPYSLPAFVYCRDMKNLVAKLGYTVDQADVVALMNAVSSNKTDEEKTTEINAIVDRVQGNFTTWVNNQIEDGAGFPAGSDFSAFILNNSFELGNSNYWNVSEENRRGTVSKVDGSYIYSSTMQHALSQTITNLPSGDYELTANTTGTMTVTVGDGSPISVVDGKISFSVVSGQSVKIQVAGTSFTADDFKLTLVGGAATESFQKISISSVGYASCVAKYNLDFTGREDIHAYAVVPDVSNSVVHLLPLNQVTKGTAFIVAGSEGVFNVSACTEALDDNLSKNQFVASESAVTTTTFANTSIYYLGVSDGAAVFKKLTSGSLAAGKGFFKVDATEAPLFRITLEEQNETSVDVLPAIESTSQIIYSISGQKQNKIGSNGLYIVNGKKVWINK